MSKQLTNISREGLELICSLIRESHSVSDGINDAIVSDVSTFSSHRIQVLLDALSEADRMYCENLIGNLKRLVTEIVDVVPTIDTAKPNTLYLYKASDDTSNVYMQYMLINEQIIMLGSTSVNINLTIDSNTKHWILDGRDLGICAEADSIQENVDNTNEVYKLDVVNGSGDIEFTTPNLHGRNANITPNENNTLDDYRLDITRNDGVSYTTPNLMARDEVSVPLNGFFKVYVENGNMILECEDGATPPPLAIETYNGFKCLTYTVGGTIQGTLIN